MNKTWMNENSSYCKFVRLNSFVHTWYVYIYINIWLIVYIFLTILLAMSTLQYIIFMKIVEENNLHVHYFGIVYDVYPIIISVKLCAILSQKIWVIEIFILLWIFIISEIINSKHIQYAYLQSILMLGGLFPVITKNGLSKIYFIINFHFRILVMKNTFSSNDQNCEKCENTPFSSHWWKHLDGKYF